MILYQSLNNGTNFGTKLAYFKDIFDEGDSFATLLFVELLESQSKPMAVIMEMLL